MNDEKKNHHRRSTDNYASSPLSTINENIMQESRILLYGRYPWKPIRVSRSPTCVKESPFLHRSSSVNIVQRLLFDCRPRKQSKQIEREAYNLLRTWLSHKKFTSCLVDAASTGSFFYIIKINWKRLWCTCVVSTVIISSHRGEMAKKSMRKFKVATARRSLITNPLTTTWWWPHDWCDAFGDDPLDNCFINQA